MKKIDFYHLGLTLIIFIFVAEHSFASNVDTNEELEKFSASKIYVYDDVNEQWNLLRDIRYFFTDMGRVDSTEVFSPTIPGLKLNDEVHKYSYDELGRTDSLLIMTDGRNEELYEYSYFENTEMLTETKTSVFPDLVNPMVLDHIKWTYNDKGNILKYVEVKLGQQGDSINYEYDDQDRTSVVTHYRYEPLSGQRVPWYLSTFNYDGNKLMQIDIDFWNLGAQEWVEYQRIVDIEPMIDEEKSGEVILKSTSTLPISPAILPLETLLEFLNYNVQQLSGNVWVNLLLISFINNQDGTTTKKIERPDDIPPSIEEITRHYERFGVPTMIAALTAIEEHRRRTFFGDKKPGEDLTPIELFLFSAYNLNENGDLKLGLSQEVTDEQFSNSLTKSTAVERVLTLTTKIYTVEAGGWYDRFKQEFYYEGNLTDVSNNTLEDRISVFPNPTTGKFHIQQSNANGPITIDIFNSVGQQIYSEKTEPLSNKLSWTKNMEGYDKGLYFIRINSGNTTFTKKLILN